MMHRLVLRARIKPVQTDAPKWAASCCFTRSLSFFARRFSFTLRPGFGFSRSLFLDMMASRCYVTDDRSALANNPCPTAIVLGSLFNESIIRANQADNRKRRKEDGWARRNDHRCLLIANALHRCHPMCDMTGVDTPSMVTPALFRQPNEAYRPMWGVSPLAKVRLRGRGVPGQLESSAERFSINPKNLCRPTFVPAHRGEHLLNVAGLRFSQCPLRTGAAVHD